MSLRPRALVLLIALLPLAIIISKGALPTAVAPVLTSLLVQKSAGHITSVSWNADGDQAAIQIWNRGLYFLSVDKHLLAGPLTTDKPTSQVALSPDARFVLASASREIRIYRTVPFGLLARAEALPGCIFSEGENAAFTADGRSIWVRCRRDRQERTFNRRRPSAIRFEVADLKTADVIWADNATPTSWEPMGSVTLAKGRAALVDVGVTQLSHIPETPTYELMCMWLDNQTPCFTKFQLSELQNLPRIVSLSEDLATAVTVSSKSIGRENVGEINVYQTTTGSRLSQLSVPDELRNSYAQDVSLTADGSLAIGAFNGSGETLLGGIVIWDVSTGKPLKVSLGDPVKKLSLSPGNRTVLTATKKQFRVDQLGR